MAVDAACIRAASEAAGGRLSEDEIRAAAERMETIRKRIVADGEVDGLNDRLRAAAANEAEQARFAARLARRQAAINALVRDRLMQRIDRFITAGMRPSDAMLAVFEGSSKPIEGASVSVETTRMAWRQRFVADMWATLDEEGVSALQLVADDRKVNDNVAREMFELREGGTPGVTGDQMAIKAAKVLATYLEMARQATNRLGGYIAKLDGYVPQSHDVTRLLRDFTGPLSEAAARWAEFIAPKLDLERSFPDAAGPAEVRRILSDVFKEIVTGKAHAPSAGEVGGYVGPSSLAGRVSRSRTLHFRSIDARNEYDALYGHGNVFQQVVAHQERMAATAAQLEHFGPNPEVMITGVLETLRRRINDEGNLPADAARKESGLLSIGDSGIGSPLGNAYAEMTGASRAVHDISLAKIGNNFRQMQAMAKLGAMAFTSAPSDAMQVAWASAMRGGGFAKTLKRQIRFLLRGRPKGEQARMIARLGVGFDTALGQAMQGRLAMDGLPGVMSRMTERFFRWSGQAWLDDMQRSGAAAVIVGEIADRAAVAYDRLPPRYRMALERHGITAAKWDAIRSAEPGVVDGERYLTPELMRTLPDEVLEPLIAQRLGDAATRVKTEEGLARVRTRLLGEMREELEMDLRRMIADEVRNSVLTVSAKSRRIMYQGKPPGTWSGEFARVFWLFRSFTVEFSNRNLARAWHTAEPGQEWAYRTRNFGTLIASMTVAGYIALALKDTAKGQWPPRDPADPAVWMASLVQGGGAGIFGDFLFGEANRFGGGALQTLAGPGLGTIGDVITVWQGWLGRALDASKGEAPDRAAEKSLADAFNAILSNTPFANLFWTRPALEIAVVNPLREWASPGYLRRTEQRLMREYGQEYFLPRTIQ